MSFLWPLQMRSTTTIVQRSIEMLPHRGEIIPDKTGQYFLRRFNVPISDSTSFQKNTCSDFAAHHILNILPAVGYFLVLHWRVARTERFGSNGSDRAICIRAALLCPARMGRKSNKTPFGSWVSAVNGASIPDRCQSDESAAGDFTVATNIWRQGIIPSLFCNNTCPLFQGSRRSESSGLTTPDQLGRFLCYALDQNNRLGNFQKQIEVLVPIPSCIPSAEWGVTIARSHI